MIRIASVYSAPAQLVPRATPEVPKAVRQMPVPPVTPAVTVARIATDASAAQSEAVFAMAAARHATPPDFDIDPPKFVDPLPDLPTADVADPRPEATIPTQTAPKLVPSVAYDTAAITRRA